MSAHLPRVFSIAAGGQFLACLADQILNGFPLESAGPPLSDWTVFLPTQRAVRVFREILLAKTGRRAMIMPRLRPLGELDGDGFADGGGPELPNALSATARIFELSRLVEKWADRNSQLAFANTIRSSPAQALQLAESLADFVNAVEIGECDLSSLDLLYEDDLSEHRGAVVSLLQLVHQGLTGLHERQNTLGASARRSLLIRREAQRIASGGHRGPIIAAGSTGTIPATRILLAAISRHDQGAVILPGLDFFASDDSWSILPEEHAQIALRELLDELGLRRSDVRMLGPPSGPRQFLASEVMRPTGTAEVWHATLPSQSETLERGLSGITEIAAKDRHLEARTIAVILRETLLTPGRTAALVTPDRDLAFRVAAELRRWNIEIADTAGRSLRHVGLGHAFHLLLEAMRRDFDPASMLALLHYPDVSLSIESDELAETLQWFEILVLRGSWLGNASYVMQLQRAKAVHEKDRHPHPILARLPETQWPLLEQLAAAMDQLAGSLRWTGDENFAVSMKRIVDVFHRITGSDAWERRDGMLLADHLEEAQHEAFRRGILGRPDVILLLHHLLASCTLPSEANSRPRLSILGTLEARLMPADVLVMGGLNEGIWPSLQDPGPWLNRTMRARIGLPQPERGIALAAHDFEQGLGYGEVYLTWSQRLGQAPAGPSRWLLRLNSVRAAAGIETDPKGADRWLRLAQALQEPDEAQRRKGPVAKPAPTPPANARPRRFSATETERLIRNPYAIYARRILKVEALPDFAPEPDAALRGSLFHDAIAAWNEAQAPDIELLLAEGQKSFASLREVPEARNFWWPHFKRLAAWLADQEEELRQNLLQIHAECTGRMEFDVGGERHVLTARADRIDILQSGEARLIDYKTGQLPSGKQVQSGLNPQLTLETAVLLAGGFDPIKPNDVAEAIYMRIARGRDGLKRQRALPDDSDLATVAAKHLAGLKSLLGIYLSASQPYLPRLRSERDEAGEEYDHLSRYLEWQLSGTSP